MSGWVIVSKKLLDNQNEIMLVETIANIARRKRSKTEKILGVVTDVVYYSVKFAVLKTVFG